MPDCEAGPETAEEAPAAQLFLLLSAAAASGRPAARTMQFKGSIEGQDILILVDSGSSHSFINRSVASRCSGVRQLPSTEYVQVADGNSVPCLQEIPTTVWSVQGYEFHSTLKVLPLGSYDMILGMDWLEAFSPYEVALGTEVGFYSLWLSSDPASRTVA